MGDTVEVLYVGMGCFWGAEEYYWNAPGVVSTAVGYQGGYSAHPTYEEVCSGRTGSDRGGDGGLRHPQDLHAGDAADLLGAPRPDAGYRQGNDVGTQYRSALYWTTEEQRELIERPARRTRRS